MTEETKRDVISVTDPYIVETVFVNEVVGSGHLNGVCNLTFATYLFTPTEEGKVEPDRVISSRMRMDMYCVHQLYAALGRIISDQAGEKPN